MEIKNKTALVTGGAKGLGKEFVKSLYEERSNIIVLDKDKEYLKTTQKEFPEIDCIECDITNYDEVESVIEKIYEKIEKIDILINNASINYNSPLTYFSKEGIKKHPKEKWDKTIDSCLNSVFNVSVNIASKMLEKRTKGLIINISSVSSSGNAGQSAYSASKAGINSLTKAWSKELSPLGIRVVAISPGFISAGMVKSSIKNNMAEKYKSETPLKRLGKPKEISKTLKFVIENDFLNGKTIEVDGGLKI